MEENVIYVLHYEGKPIIVEKRKGYRTPRPSKRVYFSERDAKVGIRNLPGTFDRSKVEIVAYVPAKVVV